MSGQGSFSHPTPCPTLVSISPSYLLFSSLQLNLSVFSPSTQVSLNFGTELSNLTRKAEVRSESLYWPVFPALQGQCRIKNRGSFNPQKLICLPKAALLREEVATI